MKKFNPCLKNVWNNKTLSNISEKEPWESLSEEFQSSILLSMRWTINPKHTNVTIQYQDLIINVNCRIVVGKLESKNMQEAQA